MVGVGLRGFWRRICIRRAECLCAFQEKEWGARTVRQGLTRMQGYIARGRCKSLETIYHLRCKGKASPEGDGCISYEAGFSPRALWDGLPPAGKKTAAAIRGVQLRKHSKAREKRYSFGYAVSFIFACYQILWTFPKSRYLCSRYLPLVCG